MSTAIAFRRCLEDENVAGLRVLWRRLYPHLHQPKDDLEARIMLHRARTTASSIPVHQRLYSHAWLEERGFPSGLPDKLRPPMERVFPRIVPAVGVAVKTFSTDPERIERAKAVQHAMAVAGGEAIDSGIKDSKRVSALMWEARDRVLRGS